MSIQIFVSTLICFSFFFFNDPATTEIYTLSLHDALPIANRGGRRARPFASLLHGQAFSRQQDRKSTRLNSHDQISYAVFCLKKKKKKSNIHNAYQKKKKKKKKKMQQKTNT